MPRRVRAALLAALVLLLVGVAGVVGLRAWHDAHRSTLSTAMALAPAGAERFSFTDWAGVRRELGARLDARSPYDGDDGVAAFLDAAFDADLSSTSALVSSAQALQEELGFSPASVEWELFSQGRSGAAVLLRLPDDTDTDALGERWEALGYTRPDGDGSDGGDAGVWDGGPEVVAGIGGGGLSLSPELQYLAVDADAHLVVASDRADYAGTALRAATGGGDVVTGLDDVVDALDAPLSAAVYSGDNACRALAMSQADDSDQEQGEELVEEAGGVAPLTGFAMGSRAGGGVEVAMGFETDDQARTNADSRAQLASGPAPGQGGDFTDRFRLRSTTAEGRVVVLDLDPLPGTFVLSDLSTGPVLYATC